MITQKKKKEYNGKEKVNWKLTLPYRHTPAGKGSNSTVVASRGHPGKKISIASLMLKSNAFCTIFENSSLL